MKTNDMKKGTMVKLRNGWEAEIADNLKGNARLCKVFGEYTELGSVYAYDIMQYFDTIKQGWFHVEHTEKQLQVRAMNKAMGF